MLDGGEGDLTGSFTSLRSRDEGVAWLALVEVPLLGFLVQLGIVVARAEALLVVALARGVGAEPGAYFLAEGGFVGRVVEVHGLLQSPHPEERPQGASRRGGLSLTFAHPSRRIASRCSSG